LFETVKTYDKLNMYCFNNVFSLITYAGKMNPDDIESFIRHLTAQLTWIYHRVCMSGQVGSTVGIPPYVLAAPARPPPFRVSLPLDRFCECAYSMMA
jgi:hypothetical protein